MTSGEKKLYKIMIRGKFSHYNKEVIKDIEYIKLETRNAHLFRVHTTCGKIRDYKINYGGK